MDNLWNEVAECFDIDDGSLPSIEVANLNPTAVSAVYSMLRKRSRLWGDAPEFWSRSRNQSVLVDSVPDAAVLVVTGEADSFHHCIEGVVSRGVELPVLGVFVWPDGIELDYRMGKEWGPAQVAGFFQLLQDCCSLHPSATVRPAEFEVPPFHERFLRAWSWFMKSAERDEPI